MDEELLSGEELMHLYQEWEKDYAEMKAEWYQDNIGEI